MLGNLWTKWKEDKCPVYEKFEDADQSENDKSGRLKVVTAIVKKRRTMAKSGGHKKGSTRGKRQAANATVQDSISLLWESQGVSNRDRLALAAKRFVSLICIFFVSMIHHSLISFNFHFPIFVSCRRISHFRSRRVADALTEFRKQVEEAEDPENEVEEEYHPKNQADFAWKCLRSLSHSHLDLFEFMERTDEEKAGSVKTALQKLKDKENGRELKNVRPVKKSSGSGSSSSSSSSTSTGSGASSSSSNTSKKSSSSKGGKRKRDEDEEDSKKAAKKKKDDEKMKGMAASIKKKKQQKKKNTN